MKLLVNGILSFLLLVLPLSLAPSARGAGAPEVSTTLKASGCCKAAPAPVVSCCHSRCCVSAPESPSRPVSAPARALPNSSESFTATPAALLHALWILPAPASPSPRTPSPDVFGAASPGMPLFLRHAALLI